MSALNLPAALDALPTIGLDELNGAVALHDRTDTKYIATAEQVGALVERLTRTHRVLQIDRQRAFRYLTTYYDTPDLLTFREQMQGRRRRFKCRKRRYVETGRAVFEVKLKGRHGRTVKHAMTCAAEDRLSPEEQAFLRDRLREAYQRDVPYRLHPVLTIACRRVTLAAPALGERLTCDVELDLAGGRLNAGLAIVESKSAHGNASADRVLRELGLRPLPRCSKYCFAVALTRDGVCDNELRPLLRRFFGPSTRTLNPVSEPS